MNVLTSVIELKNDNGVADVEDLLTRVDAMHDEFTSDPTVQSADIFSDHGSEIHIMLKVQSLNGEEQPDVQARTEELLEKAFAAAKIEVAQNVATASKVREFALV